jgi:hypothetical protein
MRREAVATHDVPISGVDEVVPATYGITCDTRVGARGLRPTS